MNDLADEYVPVGTTRSSSQAELWSLVLLSAGIAPVVEQQATDYVLMTAASQALRAEFEIGHFEMENRNWPPPKNMVIRGVAGAGARPPTVLVMGSLAIFYQVTGPFAAGNEWFRQGAANSRAIIEGGEWWRLITAMTLHSDSVHLLSNISIGGLVIHFLCKMLGTGTGWFMVLLAGMIANLANAFARGPGYLSLGFSTAVFAAVGLLCGTQIKLLNLRAVLLPLGAGVALLAMLGSSGQRTDLGAHLWGLVVGLLLGMAWSWLDQRSPPGGRQGGQTCLLAFTLLAIWLAWQKALAL